MKKLISFVLMCLMALSMSAQRCAVLEFKAGSGISQTDVDGISAIFITYFRPAGYTMVERTQIDKAIDEQGFQRSRMTESQMVRIGQILNVSKIVVGDVNVVMGQYNVDVRVINVESGTIAATEGATFSGSSYRTTMQSIAQKLAGKIAIRASSTVPQTQSQSATPSPKTSKVRNSVETIYGYLKVFPKEIGHFEEVPKNVIRRINEQAQYGYNNWRVPTKEELSLLKANNYLVSGVRYISDENCNGNLMLVTDGKDVVTLKKEAEEMRVKAQIAKQEEEKRAEQRRKEKLATQGWIDLGLPSGTLWKDQNEAGGFYTYEQAVAKFGNSLPTKEQLEELEISCRWTWNGGGYKVEGSNGKSIVLPAAGFRDCNGGVCPVGSIAFYWSSTRGEAGYAWYLCFGSSVRVHNGYDSESSCRGLSVRLVSNP